MREIKQADSLDSALFDNQFIDLTITSPPYNVNIQYGSNNDNLDYGEYLNFTKDWLTNVFNWTKSTGRLCLNVPLIRIKEANKV